MVNIPIHWFIFIIFLLVFFLGLSIFWLKQYNEKDKQAERYEGYYFEKKKEYEELHKKANRLALTLTGQLIDDITTILINSEVPNNEQSKIITKDDEYIIDSKVTKTKSYIFWGDEDE